MRDEGPQGTATEALKNREGTAMADLQAGVAQLSESQERLFAQSRNEREQARTRLFRAVVVCGILGPLGALFIYLVLAGRLVRRLHAVEENARRLAHGLPLEPLPPGSDEIDALGNQLEDAAFLLRERERELSVSERRYRDLFDRAPIPYEETDLEGVISRFNQAVCTLLEMLSGADDRPPARGISCRRSTSRRRATP